MSPLLIIKTGDTFPELAAASGDFDDWIAAGLGLRPGSWRSVAVHRDETLPDWRDVPGIVITGSPAMVTEQTPWMQRTAVRVGAAVTAGVPLLGICFGHQLLAAALGGEVDWNPRGREIGTVTVNLTPAGCDDPLLGAGPAAFSAQVTHRQSVVRLPPGARHLASSAGDPHQAFAIGSAWGVQFHPEFSPAAMCSYLNIFSPELRAEGRDPERLRESVRETPEAAAVLRRFARLVEMR